MNISLESLYVDIGAQRVNTVINLIFQFLRNVKIWQENLQDSTYLEIKEVAAVEQLLNDLEDFKQEMEDAFETVGADSKALLAELQKTPVMAENQFLKNPEFSQEAGSHVMDIYLEVHEHHRQLGILWEKRKARLKEFLHLCMFDQDSSQVRNFLISKFRFSFVVLYVFYRGSGENLLKYQLGSPCVIKCLILVTIVFCKAVILQGEI